MNRRDVLTSMSAIYVILEREYRGPGTPVQEAKWQMDHMKRVLDAST
jgi:hypothetical protein